MPSDLPWKNAAVTADSAKEDNEQAEKCGSIIESDTTACHRERWPQLWQMTGAASHCNRQRNSALLWAVTAISAQTWQEKLWRSSGGGISIEAKSYQWQQSIGSISRGASVLPAPWRSTDGWWNRFWKLATGEKTKSRREGRNDSDNIVAQCRRKQQINKHQSTDNRHSEGNSSGYGKSQQEVLSNN